jgi:hypothetical protein
VHQRAAGEKLRPAGGVEKSISRFSRRAVFLFENRVFYDFQLRARNKSRGKNDFSPASALK